MFNKKKIKQLESRIRRLEDALARCDPSELFFPVDLKQITFLPPRDVQDDIYRILNYLKLEKIYGSSITLKPISTKNKK